MSFLVIPGVTVVFKVKICKLVMFWPKYLIWRQVLFLNLMQGPEKLFHNVILAIFSLKNVNRTPYLEGNTQLFHPPNPVVTFYLESIFCLGTVL